MASWGGFGFNVLDVDKWHIASFRSSRKLPHGASWLVRVASVLHPVSYK